MDPIEVFLHELLKATIALFVVVDPIGLVPVFMTLTKGMRKEGRKTTLKTAILTGWSLLTVFTLAGQQLFAFFGISVHSFMIAGGILLLLLSIEILLRNEWAQKFSSARDVGAIPMAFPLLVGPGAITATIVMMQSSGFIVTMLSFSLVMFVTWAVLMEVDRMHSFLHETGAAVVSRLMAVFTAAIAIQFILAGIQFYYPPG